MWAQNGTAGSFVAQAAEGQNPIAQGIAHRVGDQ